MDPLRTLESLRAAALQEARTELAAAQREHVSRSAVWTTAQERCQRASSALSAARAQFAMAACVSELRLAEQVVRAATLDLVGASTRVDRAARARAAAEARLREAELRVRENTVGQRAVGLVLEQQVAAELRRAEQRSEDETDDLLRARG
jgi:hypothetical protein